MLGFFTHPDCALHEMGAWHPESPARLRAIEQALSDARDTLPAPRRFDAPLVTREQLAHAHATHYIDEIFRLTPAAGQRVQIDPDTVMNAHTLTAALRAAGAVVAAADAVMTGEISRAFCGVRPPGHHAEHARAMGFCVFNNIAVGVAHALAAHDIARVAIVDFDVHHGNGTEDIFRDDARVLLCSTFQHPFYPHCGADTVSDHIVNVPLPAGTGSAQFRQAVERNIVPALEAFHPEVLFFSAGFDAHVEDDMSSLRLSDDDYAWITRRARAATDAYTQGRIVSVLEGGYALAALGRSVVAHLRALGE